MSLFIDVYIYVFMDGCIYVFVLLWICENMELCIRVFP